MGSVHGCCELCARSVCGLCARVLWMPFVSAECVLVMLAAGNVSSKHVAAEVRCLEQGTADSRLVILVGHLSRASEHRICGLCGRTFGGQVTNYRMYAPMPWAVKYAATLCTVVCEATYAVCTGLGP